MRLYLRDEEWIVKGATALLARDLGVRATNDIDIFRRVAREAAEVELREAAGQDVGDWFRFEIGTSTPAGDGSDAIRLPVTAHIGPTVWQTFHIDLTGGSLRMSGQPDDVPQRPSVSEDASACAERPRPRSDRAPGEGAERGRWEGSRRRPGEAAEPPGEEAEPSRRRYWT